MSEYSIQVDQFLINSLFPEIESLTLSLSKMEKYGYDNQALEDTKHKLSKLTPIYDFLKEYAYGKEEASLDKLQRLMSIVGAELLSPDTSQKVLPSIRSRNGLNNHYDLDYLRMYINGEVVTNNLIVADEEPYTLDIYLPKKYRYISVIVNIDNTEIVKDANSNHVRITGVVVDCLTSNMSIEVTGKTNNHNEPDFTKTIIMDVKNNVCDTVAFAEYYIGTTQERFTISATDINESTNIRIDPNGGSNQLGVKIDDIWVTSNLERRLTYSNKAGEFTDNVVTAAGDVHIIVAFPADVINVTDVLEKVLGMDAEMIKGVHWEEKRLPGNFTNFNYIYFRDLANFEYTSKRDIHFTAIVGESPCEDEVLTTYYVGSTTDHFTISTTDINESTDISVNPNSGSNQSGTKIDYSWVVSNLEPTTVRIDAVTSFSDSIFSNVGDAHLIVAFSTADIDVTTVVEKVLGMDAEMTRGIHWEEATLPNAPTSFNYIYFRDLTNFEYTTKREIQFTINI